MPNYARSFEELHRVASNFWPPEIKEIESTASVIPVLIETQDQFISVIGTGAPTAERLFAIIEASGIAPNLFVKHLVILADFGGEMLQRVSNEAQTLFPEYKIDYVFNGQQQTYVFREFPRRKFGNTNLSIDGKKLFRQGTLTNLQKDVIALLVFGNLYGQDNIPEIESVLEKCIISDYLGKPTELSIFVKQRYIWVSKITSGARTNSLGQIVQNYVADYIEEHLVLANNFEVRRGGRLPGVTHTNAETGRFTSFDIVVTNGIKYVAIEVSFQETTNSVIERKSQQARARFEQVERAGHKIAYVLDGSGNFQRSIALSVICSYSHCTVAFSHTELDVLCSFLREQLEQ